MIGFTPGDGSPRPDQNYCMEYSYGPRIASVFLLRATPVRMRSAAAAITTTGHIDTAIELLDRGFATSSDKRSRGSAEKKRPSLPF